jgi:hypothetical protein
MKCWSSEQDRRGDGSCEQQVIRHVRLQVRPLVFAPSVFPTVLELWPSLPACEFCVWANLSLIFLSSPSLFLGDDPLLPNFLRSLFVVFSCAVPVPLRSCERGRGCRPRINPLWRGKRGCHSARNQAQENLLCPSRIGVVHDQPTRKASAHSVPTNASAEAGRAV